MNDLELLRRTLVDQAGAAPDGSGFVEAARAGAARIRTRRRVLAAGAVVTLAVGAAIVPGAISRLLPTGLSPVTSATPRGPFQLTVDVAANSGYRKLKYGTLGTRQHLSLRASGNSNEWGSEVVVHDPGTFDGAPFQSGEKVTVRGHRAYYVTDLLVGVSIGGGMAPIDPDHPEDIRKPAIGWPDPSGAWVIVYLDKPTGGIGLPQRDDKADLLRVAGALRIGNPRDMRASFHLGYLPPAVAGQPASVTSNNFAGDDTSGVVVKVGVQPSKIDMYMLGNGDWGELLRVDMGPIGDLSNPSIQVLGPPEVRIAGYEGWYNTDPTPGWQVTPNTGHLMLNDGRCSLNVSSSDLAKIPYEELKRVVEGAQFADCMQPSTWLRPLPDRPEPRGSESSVSPRPGRTEPGGSESSVSPGDDQSSPR
ncbi:hypothetical protein [Virgisporangium aurantiacum]|uniref:Uncharacterized protein n=1 Tax=Virgisporangium aurantiacum TaxID=175570 RepID=A0A8J4E745_9ACTN|nr:hypothetical protein [Virgisporangium aurantiacum]GIJ63793.1 hypothetical protein Vau01_113090 [Virgisporangium aurantiacum]